MQRTRAAEDYVTGTMTRDITFLFAATGVTENLRRPGKFNRFAKCDY
jgi:hypothetical protein